eukprot:TRINITY_DN23076_c0_g1_i1.p1 TRINITY_DN23076_c0_g1~~TRINITY_DN23076_c0_g1_i1.p1  ORF type:complete len:288 (+),score=66.96 TRINITY_DN23076_c0_g1_i1:116-979(+)
MSHDEATPLLGGDRETRLIYRGSPAEKRAGALGVGSPGQPCIVGLPADCWLAIMSYLVRRAPTKRNPLEADETWQVLQFAHMNYLVRSLVVHMLASGTGRGEGAGKVVCVAVRDDDVLHEELSEHCLMRPAKARAARQLSRGAESAGNAALEMLLTVAQSVYLFLFLPTTCTLLGLVKPSWTLWTVSIAGVMFLPLFYLGWLASKATFDWWIAINPVRACPHLNRRLALHYLHPTPWLRIAVIQSLTILVSIVIAYLAFRLGTWMDTQSPQITQWLLVFLVMCCYCP